MSIFSKKVTPEAARAGVYPKRLSYDERQELNAEYDRRHQTSLPKLPSLSIAFLLTIALAATWMFIKLTTLFIKASGQSAVFLLFFLFIFIAICYGVTFFYVKRTLDRLSVSGTKFVIVYVALISVVLGLPPTRCRSLSYTSVTAAPNFVGRYWWTLRCDEYTRQMLRPF